MRMGHRTSVVNKIGIAGISEEHPNVILIQVYARPAQPIVHVRHFKWATVSEGNVSLLTTILKFRTVQLMINLATVLTAQSI